MVFHLVWPPETWKKKIALGIICLAAVCFAILAWLPDTTKMEIIRYFKQMTNRSHTSLEPPAAVDSQASQPEVSKTPKMKRPAPFKRTQEQTKTTNTQIINQHTEGDQSPAIISNDVNIIYDAPKDRKTKD
jgi:hypothetical protein